MQTETQRKEWEISQAWSKAHDELRKIIQKEFPVGTKVKWKWGTKDYWQFGVVEQSARYDFSTDLTVRNTKTGSRVKKEAKIFYLDNDSTTDSPSR